MKNALLILIIGAIAYTLLSQKKKAKLQLTESAPLSFQKIYDSLITGKSNGKKAEETKRIHDAFGAFGNMSQADIEAYWDNRLFA
jgi:hypothetical protein